MFITLTELLRIVEDRMALKLQRIDAIEATQADHAARIVALEAAVAAWPPAADFGPAIDAVRADVDALKTELGAVEA